MSEHTEQDTSSRRLWSNVSISMSCSEQGLRGTQLGTMRSCDFLFLGSSGALEAWLYENIFICPSQSWNVVLRAFAILSLILIPKNVTLILTSLIRYQ